MYIHYPGLAYIQIYNRQIWTYLGINRHEFFRVFATRVIGACINARDIYIFVEIPFCSFLTTKIFASKNFVNRLFNMCCVATRNRTDIYFNRSCAIAHMILYLLVGKQYFATHQQHRKKHDKQKIPFRRAYAKA